MGGRMAGWLTALIAISPPTTLPPVGADPCVRPKLRAHTRVRPYIKMLYGDWAEVISLASWEKL